MDKPDTSTTHHSTEQNTDQNLDQIVEPAENVSAQDTSHQEFETDSNTHFYQQKLDEAENKVKEHIDALVKAEDHLLRAKAECENIRRRSTEDIQKAQKFATKNFATEMLPIKDSLEAALNNANQDFNKLQEGIEITLKQLISAFERSGLYEENPINMKFDPNKHQAISMQESDQEANTVIQVLQKGYLLHDRVIRPAMVIVSKGK